MSALVASCCPIIRRWWWLSSLAHSRRCTQIASTLGLGRAPGTDQITAHALRRDLQTSAEQFPQDVMELLAYFADSVPGQRIHAVPGVGLHVPIYLLGSSLFGAELAAVLGLPFAFASHFAPDALLHALALYRGHFQPSEYLDAPYAMVTANVIAADTDAEARATIHQYAAGVREHATRQAGSGAGTDRRHRIVLVAVREGADGEFTGAFICRLADDSTARA